MRVHVLVGGRPAAGKTTLGRALAPELDIAHLSKDEVKEALMDRLGPPASVEESRRLGSAAVAAVLRAASGCPAAVVDSTWYPYSLPMVLELSEPLVEVRCQVDIAVARERYENRRRDAWRLGFSRSEDELWGAEVVPLGVGPLLDVDTSGAVDVTRLASRITALADE